MQRNKKIFKKQTNKQTKKTRSSGAGAGAGCRGAYSIVPEKLSLPCSPSLESESNSKKGQKAREDGEGGGGEEKMCGRGGDKEDNLECRAGTEGRVCL